MVRVVLLFIFCLASLQCSHSFFRRAKSTGNKGSVKRFNMNIPKIFNIVGGGMDGGGNGGDGIGMVAGGEDIPNPKGQTPSLIGMFINAYNNQLTKNPNRTKIITSGIVGGLGDVLIQLLNIKMKEDVNSFDYRRLAVFSTVSALYIAPAIGAWFNWLNSLPYPANFNHLAKTLAMLLLDQTLGAVIVNIGYVYAFEIAQRAYPPYDIIRKPFNEAALSSMKRDLWTILVTNWSCWPSKLSFLC